MEVLESYTFRSKGQARSELWDKVLDGRIWRLTPDDYPHKGPESFRSSASASAKYRGMQVRTTKEPNGVVVIQAYRD